MMVSEKLRNALKQVLELPIREREILIATIRAKTSDTEFRGSFAKLQRARECREELDAYMRSYFGEAANRMPLYAEFDRSGAAHVFRIASVPEYTELLEQVALRVGDAANNLRAALDHAVCQLASRALGQQVEDLSHDHSFPIYKDRETYARRTVRQLAGLSESHRAVIENYQPYHGQDHMPDGWEGAWVHPFAQLQEINNHDKHRGVLYTCVLPTGCNLALPPDVHILIPPVPLTLDSLLRSSPFRESDHRVEVGAEVCRYQLRAPGLAERLDFCGTAVPSVKMVEKRNPTAVLERIEGHVQRVLTELMLAAS